jgi:hypothetical protein
MRCTLRPIVFLLVAALALPLVQQTALACSLTIAAFDSTRSIRPFLAPSPTFGNIDFFSNIRAELQSHFGAELTFAPQISDARGSALDNVNVLIMSEVQPLASPADAAAEALAIANFVRNGGCLVIQTDTLHQSYPDALNNVNGAAAGNAVLGNLGAVPYSIGVGVPGLPPDPGWNLGGVQSGTAGVLINTSSEGATAGFSDGDRFGASYHNTLTPSGAFTGIGYRGFSPSGGVNTYLLMEMLHGALSGFPEAGGVLVSGDLTWSNYYVGPNVLPPDGGGSWGNCNNARLLENFLEECGCEAPEPGSLALLGIGGIALLAAQGRRRGVR